MKACLWVGRIIGGRILKIDAAFWRLEELTEELYEQTNRLTDPLLDAFLPGRFTNSSAFLLAFLM